MDSFKRGIVALAATGVVAAGAAVAITTSLYEPPPPPEPPARLIDTIPEQEWAQAFRGTCLSRSTHPVALELLREKGGFMCVDSPADTPPERVVIDVWGNGDTGVRVIEPEVEPEVDEW